jgi:predicted permease
MLFDLIVASRGLRRARAFTVTAILTLALGIGANTTMFSIVNGVLLKPLPGYETDRLDRICDTGRGGCFGVPPGVYLRLRERSRSFLPLAAEQRCRFNLTGHGEAEQVDGPCATANWFELQRARALLGRTFLPDEDRHGRNRVVVLDHAYWRQRFGGDPKIVGQKLVLDGEPWLVVGVMPAGYRPLDGSTAQVYTPYVVEDNPHGVRVTGRLRPGLSGESARAELRVLGEQLARENPDWKTLQLSSKPILEDRTGPQRPLLLLLLGAVSLVLLIACVNVANLVLARATARRRDIEIRIALGAGRLDLVRHRLAELSIVGAAASVTAVAMAYGGLRLLQPLLATLPRADEVSIDVRVLGCALALAIGVAVIFALLPARPRPRSRTLGVLVATQVALAFVLATGAGLLVRSLGAIRSADLGYDPRNVLTHFIAMPESADGSRTAGVLLFERIRDRVRALPGVRMVATATSMPMFGVSMTMDVHPEGQPESRHEHVATLASVSEDYFRTMRIPLRAGRTFTAHDGPGATPVAIVSESVSRRYFGGNAIGKRVIVPEFRYNIDGGPDVANEIVGVAGDVCQAMDDCQAEHLYLAERQNGLRMSSLIVRTDGDPLAVEQAVRRAIAAEAPAVPLDEPKTLVERTAYLSDSPRRAMWLLGIFAALALLLAAAGIYGVSACVATMRTQEVAVRMALGATLGDILGLVYRATLWPTAIGLGVGVGSALWLARLLRSLLYGVQSNDPSTLLTSGTILLGVAILAAMAPAVRAALTDPARVLRRE